MSAIYESTMPAEELTSNALPPAIVWLLGSVEGGPVIRIREPKTGRPMPGVQAVLGE